MTAMSVITTTMKRGKMMRPKTICHPEALDDWRANDEESTHNYLATVQEQINLGMTQDELDHKDIAYDNGATKKGLFGVLDKVIKTSSRIAITISEKI